MPSVEVQFHADPEEVIDFVDAVVAQFELHFTVMQFFPVFSLISGRGPESVRDTCRQLATVDRICLTRRRPNLSCPGPYEFLVKNSEAVMVINIEHVSAGRLCQSFLNGGASDQETMRIWRKIAKQLKAIAAPGAWIINDDMNIRDFDRTFRHTAGARRLAKKGVTMAPIAGDNRMEFMEP